MDIKEVMNKVNLLISENCLSYEKENSSFDSWLERNKIFAYENYGIKLGKEAWIICGKIYEVITKYKFSHEELGEY